MSTGCSVAWLSYTHQELGNAWHQESVASHWWWGPGAQGPRACLPWGALSPCTAVGSLWLRRRHCHLRCLGTHLQENQLFTRGSCHYDFWHMLTPQCCKIQIQKLKYYPLWYSFSSWYTSMKQPREAARTIPIIWQVVSLNLDSETSHSDWKFLSRAYCSALQM